MDWKEKEAQALQLLEKSLSEPNWKWLRRSVSWSAGDLSSAGIEDLRRWFPQPRDPNGINDLALLRTIIWQSWIKVQVGLVEPVNGNLRSFWYQTVEPFYRQHGLLEPTRRRGRSPEERIASDSTECLGDFVRHRVFRYSGELEFAKPIDALARVGADKPKYLFYSEKEGLWYLCRMMIEGDAGTSSKISAMASNGQPSFVTLEYFAEEFFRRRVTNLVIGAFVDFDPWGYQIAEQIDAKMRFLGFKSVTTYMLTTIDLFTQEQIAKGKDLSQAPAKQRPLVEAWMAKTGGAYGKPISLHIDVIPKGPRILLAKKFLTATANNSLDREFPRVQPIDLRQEERPGRFFR